MTLFRYPARRRDAQCHGAAPCPQGSARVALSGAIAALAAGLLASSPAAAQSVRVQPHRAVYEMTTETRSQRSEVASVRGALSFEWGETCDAWLVNQRFDADFVYASDGARRISWSYATWESKDGLSYRFTLRKRLDGVLDQELRGFAVVEPDGGPGSVDFDQPEDIEIDLPDGTVFPSDHSLRMIRAAQAGETFLLLNQFDGSELDAGAEVNVVIGKPAAADAHRTLDSDLLDARAWPMRLAYFPYGTPDSVPEHEQSLLIQENGVVRTILLDYGDFTVRGTLRELEALPKPEC